MRKLVVCLAVVVLAACSSSAPSADDGRLQIVTTVAPITNLVENIGGVHVRITGLVPEGANSHTFEPAPSDAAVLADADLVFANGLHLELPSLELAEANIGPGARIVLLGERSITEREWIFDFSFPEGEGDPNPHLWTNPLYALQYAEVIALTLELEDPDHAEAYAANYEALTGRFQALDRAVRAATETVPEANRTLLTYHDSFPYFAREYGWTIVGAIQPSDFSEPTPREVGRLIDQIRDERIPAIFGSEVFPSPILERIAEETGATYVDDLRDDDLPGEPGDDDHSLIGLLVFDYSTFVTALGGDATALAAIDTANLAGDADVEYRS